MINSSKSSLLTTSEKNVCEKISGLNAGINSQRASALLELDSGSIQASVATSTGLSLGQVKYCLARFRQNKLDIFPSELKEELSPKVETIVETKLTPEVDTIVEVELAQELETVIEEDNVTPKEDAPKKKKEKSKKKDKSKTEKSKKKKKKKKKVVAKKSEKKNTKKKKSKK